MIFQNLIQGSTFTDDRGAVNFFNSFKMDSVVRMYEIAPKSIDIKRGWQGHKDEKKWFYCNSGAFIIHLVELDDFDNPSNGLVPKRIELREENPWVLEISGGCATALKAMEANSKILVFSNFTLEQSKQDDFRFPISKWEPKW